VFVGPLPPAGNADLELIAELVCGIDNYSVSSLGRASFPEGPTDIKKPRARSTRLWKSTRARIEAARHLYHWDLAQLLEEPGGWRKRDTAVASQEYAEVVVAAALGDVVKGCLDHEEKEPWVFRGSTAACARARKSPASRLSVSDCASQS